MAVCQIQYSRFLFPLDGGSGTLCALGVHIYCEGEVLRQQPDACGAAGGSRMLRSVSPLGTTSASVHQGMSDVPSLALRPPVS